MTVRKLKYILFTLAPLSAMFVTGCLDEPLVDTDCFDNPDVISFSAVTAAGGASTRAGEEKQLYEPLVLTDDAASQTLYLHTYDSERIGFEPGDDVQSGETDGAQTRGNQINTADDLINFHKDFMVHAQFKEDGVEYIEWSKTQVSSANNFWRTEKTRYWPGERELSFMAVSPTAEFNSLNNKVFSDLRAEFSYTAKKQGNNRDAEAQTDLLLAAGTCNKPNSVNGRAPLKFHHALSAIKFAVRDVLDGEVVNVQIAGVRNSGNCVYTAHSDGEGSFTWTGQTGSETYSQNFNYAINGRPAAGINPGDDSQDILLNDSMPEKTFMLIPQRIPDNAEIIVTLKRTNPGKDEDGNQLPETITVRGKIKANNVQEWLPGHEYVYTISTSKDNWVYVFHARGNHNSRNGQHFTGYNANANQIYVYSPSVNEHDTYNDDAFFDVRSYRYRANNQSVIEDLPWSASHGDAKQYRIRASGDEYVSGRDINAAEWITDTKSLRGNGSHTTSGERNDLVFTTHHQMTDWPGDKWMQDQEPYSGYSKKKPWDLSTCGGKLSRNTANCYVIDREGWYFLPFVYGNAYTAGVDTKDAYIFSGPKQSTLKHNYQYLDGFVNHLGQKITSAKIPESYCKHVSKSWADVYNVISDLEIVKYDGFLGVRFKANKFNLQQGSSCIAVFDSNNRVVWSWHIWITEHWLNPENGQPNAFDSSSAFDFSKADISGWRNRGDVQITGVGQANSKYYISPYNLGWCDPKNVDYLKRPGEMNFVQYQKDGITKSGHIASLPILQDGAQIQYKYGNNTYYQFGRKDPMVGFVDHENNVKRNFGPYQYSLGKQPVDLKEGILHPNTLFCTGDPHDADVDKNNNRTYLKSNDWCNTIYINLWNNCTENDSKFIFDTSDFNQKFYFFSKKTIYDPCPPGYMVPPGGVWKIIGTGTGGSYQSQWFTDTSLSKLNGLMNAGDPYTFRIWGGSKEDQTTTLWLTSTGHRWFSNYYDNSNKGGDNFNSQLVYLWSTTPTGRNDMSAFGLALGQHSANGYGVCAFFRGRRSMARPVRAIREAYVDPNKKSHK
jgi:hypothetical protein